jgi:Flp pilus assembly protein TadB
MIFSAKLLKADGKPVVLVILNIFTYGIFIIVIAFIALKKSKKNKAAQYAQEISALNTQLQQVESQIDITRHSLSEINQKLETHK